MLLGESCKRSEDAGYDRRKPSKGSVQLTFSLTLFPPGALVAEWQHRTAPPETKGPALHLLVFLNHSVIVHWPLPGRGYVTSWTSTGEAVLVSWGQFSREWCIYVSLEVDTHRIWRMGAPALLKELICAKCQWSYSSERGLCKLSGQGSCHNCGEPSALCPRRGSVMTMILDVLVWWRINSFMHSFMYSFSKYVFACLLCGKRLPSLALNMQQGSRKMWSLTWRRLQPREGSYCTNITVELQCVYINHQPSN